MEALARSYRKLQFQLKCKSQTSKKTFFGVDAAINNDKQTIKIIKILEQKLNGKRNRLSMIQHGNKVLTSQINEVRLLKVAANDSSEKLHLEFDQRQKEMALSMQTANKSNAIRLKSAEAKEIAVEEGQELEAKQQKEMEDLKAFLLKFEKE